MLEHLVAALHMTTSGVWYDRWDPDSMLRSHGVSFLVGAITIKAVGADEDNESNQLHVCYINANREEQVRDWDNGK